MAGALRRCGLRARGGYEVDIRWKAGRLEEAVIKADRITEPRTVQIRYKDRTVTADLNPGDRYTFTL